MIQNSGFLNSRIGDKFKKKKESGYKYENSKIMVISVSIVGRILKGEEIDGRETKPYTDQIDSKEKIERIPFPYKDNYKYNPLEFEIFKF